MSDHIYFPLIKTRDAELRCFENLSESLLEKILPIYELTKSRKTTKAPDGDIHRRMKTIKEIQGSHPFILDLSTDERYSNPQIEQLLSENSSFYEWQVFVFELYADLNIIPMIHLYEDDSGVLDDVKAFVESASTHKPFLAVRLPYDLDQDEFEYYLSPIRDNLKDNCKLFVLLDAEHIRERAELDTSPISNMFIESHTVVSTCMGDKLENTVMLCSSFPSNPKNEGEKSADRRIDADAEGEFNIYEEIIYQDIITENSAMKYGDYAAINLEQIEIRGGTFVPRIDIALSDGNSFIYKRYRRDDGSYERCAKEVLADARYHDYAGWADKEIALAAAGNPTGISPSFWISVRMEYYIRTRINLRSK